MNRNKKISVETSVKKKTVIGCLILAASSIMTGCSLDAELPAVKSEESVLDSDRNENTGSQEESSAAGKRSMTDNFGAAEDAGASDSAEGIISEVGGDSKDIESPDNSVYYPEAWRLASIFYTGSDIEVTADELSKEQYGALLYEYRNSADDRIHYGDDVVFSIGDDDLRSIAQDLIGYTDDDGIEYMISTYGVNGTEVSSDIHEFSGEGDGYCQYDITNSKDEETADEYIQTCVMWTDPLKKGVISRAYFKKNTNSRNIGTFEKIVMESVDGGDVKVPLFSEDDAQDEILSHKLYSLTGDLPDNQFEFKYEIEDLPSENENIYCIHMTTDRDVDLFFDFNACTGDVTVRKSEDDKGVTVNLLNMD